MSRRLKAWSTHVDTWRKAIEIVRLAACDNLGLCVDTFHVAGREYGDPTIENGVSSEAGLFEESMHQFSTTVRADEITYFQLSDASLVAPPFPRNRLSNREQRLRMNWSRCFRVFPSENGYFPVENTVLAALAVLATGLEAGSVWRRLTCPNSTCSFSRSL
jgi:4-hydroxyphenylpyruvate dioxygenase